jgi:nitrogen fixation/metabolism regulation signal transduction histidine kinase
MQTIYLIKYVNRTNRELAEFLIYLQQGDTSAAFNNENITKTFKGLRGSFDKINTDFQQIKSEKIQKEHYLEYVINNIKTGLIAFNDSGDVEFVNNQAKIFLNKKNHRLLQMNSLDSEFVKILNDIKPSESQILKKTINNELFYLTFSLSKFKIDQKNIKLFTIHDVKQEIETNEIESWQKLTRVLTHEMMNSITPITSLAHAIKRYLRSDEELISQQDIDNELILDIFTNADIIENRGKGLLEFINNYRTITKLPKPKFEQIETKVFLENIIQLFDKQLNERKIVTELNINPINHSFIADKGMIEQIIINLIKNSLEATIDIPKPCIIISSFTDETQKTKITVSDNGIGISQDLMENIFVPFFTTKEKGSGIGLSLSRQIMHLHNGSISVKSKPNAKTVFTLIF